MQCPPNIDDLIHLGREHPECKVRVQEELKGRGRVIKQHLETNASADNEGQTGNAPRLALPDPC